MYCPSCGVKNEEDVVKCFICGKVMPGVFETGPETKRAPGGPSRIPVFDRTAAIGDRMIAIVIDGLLLLAINGSLVAIAAYQLDLVPLSPASVTFAEVAAAISFAAIVGLFYFWLCEGLTGATLGKALIGIRVQDVYGGKANLREVLVRTLFRLVDGIGFYLVGFLVALFSKQRKRIGDHVAGTMVVNDPPTTASRVGVLVLWAALVGGCLFAVWKVVDPVRELADAILHDRETAASMIVSKPPPKTELALERFAWLDSPDGPVVELPVFKPGDRAWARFAIEGFARDEEGGVNVLTETAAFDPEGLQIGKAHASATLELPPESSSITEVDPLVIPSCAPPGEYELRVRVRDLSRSRDAVFVQSFRIDAPAATPAAVLEVRNFVFSITKDGFPVDPPVFDVGETVYYRYEVHGLAVMDDRIDTGRSYRFTGPDGRTIFGKADWDTLTGSYLYHPATFFVVQSGSVSLPSDALPGTYTVEHVVTDRLGNASVSATGQFRLR